LPITRGAAKRRRRDGAFEWEVFEDLSQQGHFVEVDGAPKVTHVIAASEG
jgi:hypothetical protein